MLTLSSKWNRLSIEQKILAVVILAGLVLIVAYLVLGFKAVVAILIVIATALGTWGKIEHSKAEERYSRATWIQNNRIKP